MLDTSGPDVAKKFHDLLFEDQPEEGSAGLSDSRLLDYAVQAGAAKADVQQGIADRTFEQWVKNVGDQASKDGVNSTPTVLVNGKKLTSKTIDGLVADVEKAAARQLSAVPRAAVSGDKPGDEKHECGVSVPTRGHPEKWPKKSA